MEFAPHQQRVVQEREDLNEKIEKLTSFVHESSIFKALPKIDQQILVEQRGVMILYKEYLDLRIEGF